MNYQFPNKFKTLIFLACILIGQSVDRLGAQQSEFQLTPEMLAALEKSIVESRESVAESMELSSKRHVLINSLPFSDLEKLRSDSTLSDQLMLVPSQVQKLKELWDAQKNRLEELDSKIKVAKKERSENEKNGPRKRAPWEQEDHTVENLLGEKDRVRREILTEFVKELQPDQIRQLANLDFQTFGMVNFMTCDIVADNLDLTDEQREKITKNSEKIGKELRDYLVRTRQDFHDAIFSELTESQLEKLGKIVPQEDLDRFFEELTLGKLQDEFKTINIAPSKIEKRK